MTLTRFALGVGVVLIVAFAVVMAIAVGGVFTPVVAFAALFVLIAGRQPPLREALARGGGRRPGAARRKRSRTGPSTRPRPGSVRHVSGPGGNGPRAESRSRSGSGSGSGIGSGSGPGDLRHDNGDVTA